MRVSGSGGLEDLLLERLDDVIARPDLDHAGSNARRVHPFRQLADHEVGELLRRRRTCPVIAPVVGVAVEACCRDDVEAGRFRHGEQAVGRAT
jgi:hypothetical protein